MFMFINLGEHLEKLNEDQKEKINEWPKENQLAYNNLLEIRRNLSHKLFLLSPSNYVNFIKCLYEDLSSLDPEVTFLQCKKFLNSQGKRILSQEALIQLFVHWKNAFETSYQSALQDKTFNPALYPFLVSICESIHLCKDYNIIYKIPSFSLIILLGQLSLKISQKLFPRDIQLARAPRQSMSSLEQLLFDLQQIRNELVHDMIKSPIEDSHGYLLFTGYYLVEIVSSLKEYASLSEASPQQVNLMYSFVLQNKKDKKIDEGLETREESKPIKRKGIRLFSVEFLPPVEHSALESSYNRTLS